MRDFSDTIKNVIYREDVGLFYMVLIKKGSLVLFADTSHATAITAILPLDGISRAYNPSTGLMSVEPPRLSQAIDKETYKIAYIDPNFEKISAFEGGLTGASINVCIGFYEPGTSVPITTDFVVAYKGTVDTQGYTINPDSGTVVAVIEGSSPVASLGQIKAFYTSKENMSRVSANDTSFDQIYVGSTKVALLWGHI